MNGKCSLAATVARITTVTAAIIESEIDNTGRFEDVNDVVAFTGLDSAIGNSSKYTSKWISISKRGCKTLRTALYCSALLAIKCNLAYADIYNRLVSKGKHRKVARIAVARNLLLHAYSVMRHGKAFTILQGFLKAKMEKGAA